MKDRARVLTHDHTQTHTEACAHQADEGRRDTTR
jgi:hypothetical protein